METEKTLSEIARSVLIASPETDPRSLREKAGLLALLNLLGIVESFYGDGQTVQSSVNLIRSIAENPMSPPTQEPSKQPDLAASIMSLATKFLGSGQGQGGFDPALIGTLMGAVSAMSKSRGQGSRPSARAGDAEVIQLEGENEDEDSEEIGDQSAPEEEEPQAEVSKPSPPSALQQILGIDPRIITLALNLIADLMKARTAGSSEKPASGATGSSSSPDEPRLSPPETSEDNKPSTEVTVTSDGKTVVIPTTKKHPRERLYHKPGLGIYRQKPDKTQAAAEQ